MAQRSQMCVVSFLMELLRSFLRARLPYLLLRLSASFPL